ISGRRRGFFGRAGGANPMSEPIEDYALIGDCETAALVSRNGSIDWLCLSRFDSGACFAALLGSPENGRWLIKPSSQIDTVTRRYRDATLILEPDFETSTGAVTLIDYMVLRHGSTEVVRLVAGRRGTVPMRMELTIRFDYGSIVPWVRKTDRGIRATAGPDTLRLYTALEMRGEGLATVADFEVAAGQTVPFQLIWSPTREAEGPVVTPAADSLRQVEAFWREWSGRCTYE